MRVVCGNAHSAVLCASGRVLWCGVPLVGSARPVSTLQLLRFPAVLRTKALPLPASSPALPQLRIVHLALGHMHAVAIAVDGTAYAWGQNDRGQLGLGHRSPRAKPVQVKVCSARLSSMA